MPATSGTPVSSAPIGHAGSPGKQVARLRPRGGFGGYLHELRRERGLTARQLAAAAGVHHTYVSKLERGDRQAPDEPVVEALAAALRATPAQIDQLRWRAGLTPRGDGAPGQDDPTLTLVAEALGDPALAAPARDQLRRVIAQIVAQAAPQGPPPYPGATSTPPSGPPAGPPLGVVPGAAPAHAAPPPSAYPPPAAWQTPPQAPWQMPGAGYGYAPGVPGVPSAYPAPGAYVASPEAPPDPRSALLAGMMGGWQTVDEAAAELRVTPAYLLSLVQAGLLRAWSLPGATGPGAPGVNGSGAGVTQTGVPVGLRFRREDVLGLLRPVQL